jgi:hypothetical protein
MRYGKRYWIIEVPGHISSDGFISAIADRVSVGPSGELTLINHGRDNETWPGLILAAGRWVSVYAASVITGDPIVVDRWSFPNTHTRPRNEAEREKNKMTPSIRYAIFARDGFACQICGRLKSDGAVLHVDHIVPVSRGGKTEDSNLRTLCSDCNHGKAARLPDRNDPALSSIEKEGGHL